MYHREAVRTEWSQVLHGIDFVIPPQRGQRLEMMDMDEAFHGISVEFAEAEAAYAATRSIKCNARLSSLGITLVTVDDNRNNCSLAVRRGWQHFLGNGLGWSLHQGNGRSSGSRLAFDRERIRNVNKKPCCVSYIVLVRQREMGRKGLSPGGRYSVPPTNGNRRRNIRASEFGWTAEVYFQLRRLPAMRDHMSELTIRSIRETARRRFLNSRYARLKEGQFTRECLAQRS